MTPILRLGLALLSLVLLAAPAGAQSYAVDRGSLLVGGSGGFSSTGTEQDEDDRTTQLSIRPSVEYFVAPGLSLGGELQYSRFSNGGDASTTFGVGPAMSYYFGGRSRRSVYPFVSVGGAYSRSGGTTGLGFDASVGALAMLADAVGVNGSLYYQNRFYEEFSDNNSFGLAVGISAFVF